MVPVEFSSAKVCCRARAIPAGQLGPAHTSRKRTHGHPSLTAEGDHAVSSGTAPTRRPKKSGRRLLIPKKYVAPPKVVASLTRLSPIPYPRAMVRSVANVIINRDIG